ncbi:alpha/beta fold hydrolase [Actinomadura nitritigenes]|uniref:alpha/beta fold hydrolase n=1 Tax=Actinomadura nitritigenes TaxID=134602 RepID=UPI003D9418E2
MVVAVNPCSVKSAAAASSTAFRVSSLYSALRPLTVMPTRIQLPTMSQFSTDSQIVLETSRGPLRYWRTGSGSGPAVIFLQGFLAGPDVWSPVVAELTGQHRCITVDWPFGAHRAPMRADADLSPPGVAELVVEVMDLLGESKAVLVGNDSGGVIAQLVTAAHPDRVAALALVACDAFEVFPPGLYRRLFRLAAVPGVVRSMAAAMSVPAIARSRFGFGAVMEHRPGSVSHWTAPLAASPGVRRDITKLMTGSSNAQTLAAARTFGRYDRPVLVVSAARDRLFPLELGRRLADAFPRGRHEVIAGSGTFVPHDQPARLAELLGGFLAGQGVR